MSRYVSLHTHSEFSMLDSTAKIIDIFARAKEEGQPAVAITDHGNLSGLWKAQNAADATGVKLIPGMEAYLAVGDRFEGNYFLVDADGHSDEDEADDAGADTAAGYVTDRSDRTPLGKKKKWYEHITLIAINEDGWLNLVAIHNKSWNSVKRHPRVDYKLISEHSEGIVILTGCLGGPILGPLSRGDAETAETNLQTMIAAVGADNVYVEVMEHGIEVESAILPQAAALAGKYNIPLVATNDSHHVLESGAETHDAWLAVRTGALLTDTKRYKFHGTGFHLRTEAEMLALRPEAWWAEAVTNTMLVADRVADRVLPRPNPKLPVFQTPVPFKSNIAYAKHLIRKGAEERYGLPLADLPVVRARLNEEFSVIDEAKFVDYFLIVHEAITWAGNQDVPILVGPGRGSAGGSLISYCLHITDICPLVNDLAFERFMERGRPDFPDIDIDFEAARRDEVIDHMQDLWGKNSVSLIGSFGAAKTKKALKDAARVLGAKSTGDKLAKLVIVEGGNNYSLTKMLDESVPGTAPFRSLVHAGGDLSAKVIELARGFEDTVSGNGIHACGIIISDLDLFSLIPQRFHEAKNRWVSLWDSKDVEAFGLVKLDFLALRNLDISRQAIQYIEETTGEHLDFYHLPDPDTTGNARVDAAWALLQVGHTAGIFQMESAKMTELSRQVQPETLTDLSAVIALYRPGPLSAGMDQHFALRKNGEEAIDYGIYTTDPTEQAAIAAVLGKTYGTFVFQEQLMELGRVMAGFDVTARGKLRKAVAKKVPAVMEAVGKMFVTGCVQEFRDTETGEITSIAFSQETAERMWDQMKGCGAYLFNASHSAAYAKMAFITAFLKANWPAAYGAAILAVTDDADKRLLALHALPNEGIDVLAPDVNLSGIHTRPEGDNAIRIGLSEIKGVGDAGERIVQVREENGEPFTSFYDVIDQVRKGGANEDDVVDNKYLPANQIDALISSGAFDQFGPRMGLNAVARVIKHAPDLHIPDLEYGFVEYAARQRSVLLTSLGTHPLSRLQADVKSWRGVSGRGQSGLETKAIPISKIPDASSVAVTTIGILAHFKEKPYAGGRFASLTLEGSKGSIDCIMWDRVLSTSNDAKVIPYIGGLLAVTGKVEVREYEREDEEGNVVLSYSKQLVVTQVYGVPVNDPVQGSLSSTAPHIMFATSIPTGPVAALSAPVAPILRLAPAAVAEAPNAVLAPEDVPPVWDEPEYYPEDDSEYFGQPAGTNFAHVAEPAAATLDDAASDQAAVARLLGPSSPPSAAPAAIVTVSCKPDTPASRAWLGFDVSDEFKRRLRSAGGTVPSFNSHDSKIGEVYTVVAADKATVLGYVRIDAA